MSGEIKSTKTGGLRRVRLDDDTLELLALYRQRLVDRASKMRVAMTADSFLFSGERIGAGPGAHDGDPHFARLCEKLGLVGVRLHDLRHFHAPELLDGGIPIAIVSQRLGHSPEHYRRLRPRPRRPGCRRRHAHRCAAASRQDANGAPAS